MEYFPLWLQQSGLKGSLLHSPVRCHLQVVLLCIPGEVYKYLKRDTVGSTPSLPWTGCICAAHSLFLLFPQAIPNLELLHKPTWCKVFSDKLYSSSLKFRLAAEGWRKDP